MIHFQKETHDAAASHQHLILVTEQRYAQSALLSKVFSEVPAKALASSISRIDKAISRPKVLTTLADELPYKQSVVLIPDQVSRHNSPMKKAFVYQGICDAAGDSQSVALTFVLEDPSYRQAFVAAAARATQAARWCKDASEAKSVHIGFMSPDGSVLDAQDQDLAVAEATAWAIRLVDTPPTDMSPQTLSDEILKRFENCPHISATVISGSDLLNRGLNGVHAVGRAATEHPRVVILDYNPPQSTKCIAMAGKGLTYDTGGLSLKISGSMVSMKSDMGGAAAVAGAFEMITQRQSTCRVIAAFGIVENAIGPKSYKPDDILKMHSGKTVEVNNTDAEGRIVLADVVSYVARKFKPQYILEAATLTGAQMVATGLMHAGIVSNDEEFESMALAAGRSSGDVVFSMPFMPEVFQDEFKSKVADMKNSVANRFNAPSACAAQFIYSHIDDLDLKWLHIDLAGPSFIAERATGYGCLLLDHLVSEVENAS